MLLFKFFLAVVVNLRAFQCSLSGSEVDLGSFLFEDGKLAVDCFNKDSSECLIQLTLYKHVSKLYLKGFVFDEVNIKLFSNAICDMQLQELTLDQCDMSDELVSLLTLPPGLKSTRLERLNFSSKGIQKFISLLPPLLESFEAIDCLNSDSLRQQVLMNLTTQKTSLDFSRFSRLKNICIEKLSNDIDSYQLLLSLTLLPLERVKLSRVQLCTVEWTFLLKKWCSWLRIWSYLADKLKGRKGVTFFSRLKEFNISFGGIDRKLLIRLIQFLFSRPSLEIISLRANNKLEKVFLPPLPSNIKQFSLIPIGRVSLKDGKTSFYNPKNLSQLTHLTIDESFDAFPYDLFDLSQLEYFKIQSGLFNNRSLFKDRYCAKLKYLSIQSNYLIPLLNNFKSNFPVIETLDITSVCTSNFNSYLKMLFFSIKTLKSLKINYIHNDQYPLIFGGDNESSIEELKLTNVSWKFVVTFLAVEQFPRLEKIYIESNNENFDLGKVLEKLSSFPQLTSLTLVGKFLLSNEKLPFAFKNLKIFCLTCPQEIVDLDSLTSCMPNLNELQLLGQSLRELKLQNSVGIRYLVLPSDFFKFGGEFINIVKNIPNLIRVRRNYLFSFTQCVPYAPQVAYYFKMLKEHFQSELRFKINFSCLLIKQLEIDTELFSLVCLKSPELQKYLQSYFPIDNYKPFIKQLFTIEFEMHFDVRVIDKNKVVEFFKLLRELKVNRKEDVSFVKKLLFQEENEYCIESTDFSLDNFYKLFLDYLTQNIESNLESVHLEFIKEFVTTNKKYGIFKVFNFLTSFFTSISVIDGESKIIDREIFFFFTKYLQAPSFRSLFYKIKGRKLSEGEKKILSFDYDSLTDDLKCLDPKQYKRLCTRFKRIIIDLCDESFVESFFNVLKALLIPKTDCPICMDSLFTKECKFFKFGNSSCHLFHKECLDEWSKRSSTCPYCNRNPN